MFHFEPGQSFRRRSLDHRSVLGELGAMTWTIEPRVSGLDDAAQMRADPRNSVDAISLFHDRHRAADREIRLLHWERWWERDPEFFRWRRKHGSLRQSHRAKETKEQRCRSRPPSRKAKEISPRHRFGIEARTALCRSRVRCHAALHSV